MNVALGVAVGIAGLTVLTACVRPYFGLRLLMALIGHSLLWLRVEGRSRMPSGPLLLLSGKRNFLSWLHLLAASPRRVRFLMLAGWSRAGLVGWLLRRAGAIVPPSGDDAALRQALKQAGDAIRAGEVVCLFAEEIRTSNGESWSYSRIFDALPRVPVLPVAVLEPHGSLFVLENKRVYRQWPQWFAVPVEVTFGEVLHHANAAQARQALQECSARAAIARQNRTLPLHRTFVRSAARHPFRVCWIDSTAPGQDLTYGKAYVGAVCLAKVLGPLLGIRPMVGVWLPPGRGGALVNVALALLHKTSVNLNYTTGADVVRSCLRQCDCTHVVTARRFTARMPLEPVPGIEVIYLEDLLPRVSGFDKLLTFMGLLLLPGWVTEYVVRRLGHHRCDDLATVIFSSGSTGQPKGVMLTHANIASNLESMVQAANLSGRDRLLCVLPFFHSFGYSVTLWGPLMVGASAVFHPDPRQAKEIGELCRTHAATVYLSTATFLRFCLRKCEPDHFRTLRLIICGAEKLPPALAIDFRERFGILPLEGYGCTELSPVVSANLADETYEGVTQVANRLGTVGAPMPGIAARIVEPETLVPQPLGTDGLLQITGANVMAGYLHKPELSAQVVREGWYTTGDMARIDAEGHITITGRLQRFAKIGGEMVPLEKVEEALHEVLGIAERVCAVACVPDESRGERVIVLYIEATLLEYKQGVRPWLEALGGTGLPNLWTPSERDFHAVAELPTLGTGKLNLQEVAELARSLARRSSVPGGNRGS
ncbi:MAG: acyl-[ACP]--phospholipid O-acyltransferase, partial [Planctomycetia bacterium]|nr:acyl-[ACP]--phospholipid O-acyltransferase [Planctomycetia bacterium]